MEALILGLLLFLGTHSIGLVARPWRNHMVNRLGETPWKLLYTAVSLVGFILIIWGYGQARTDPLWLWHSPVWTRHLAALLTLPAFILVVAAYVPGNRLKARVGHPMVLGTKFWAIAHLISNGTLADLLLFGGFLVWAVSAFILLRRRDRVDGTVPVVGGLSRDIITWVVGLLAWAVFAFYLHGLLIGVRPFG
ncbi:NnrU family protein [Marinimicrobium sp. C6131]|uniref:NnrU family protein n=1 Tax=Marinimicrobium sp. C6131 TaxID=3022676 RepID=UPI00223D5AE1|nr:NnrU family protein [Marinimicrobium sp. C6131]UZJ44512.1 NnrU family protein [Marinimicrobium sp. C6131]